MDRISLVYFWKWYDFGVWVEGKHDSKEGIFLVYGPEGIMREIFGNIMEEVPMKLADLSAPEAAHPTLQRRRCMTLWIY